MDEFKETHNLVKNKVLVDKMKDKTNKFQDDGLIENREGQTMVHTVYRPKSILKIPTEIGLKCMVDSMRYPSVTKHSIIGNSACLCHIVNDDT